MSDVSSLGATYLGDGTTAFVVWAPGARRVEILLGADGVRHPMSAGERGYFRCTAAAVPGTRYRFALDGGSPLPDPASRWQPEGVHGPSAVVDPACAWTDAAWAGIPLRDCVFYELHVGTYTDEGTFDALVPHLRGLRELGVTAVEVMPIAQFPGERNWGYDGVYPFAAQASYGGPDGFRRLVDACHAVGLAVVLDVVYNHLGPEGNYTGAYGPYSTDAYRTPWGHAMNFSERGSDEVRRFFIESALWWVRDCHVDALRVDAVHAIVDPTAAPFTQELCDAVRREGERAGRRVLVIAESSRNDPRTLRPPAEGGIGFDGQWNDDWHHALHVALTGERDGYYADYGGAADLATAYRDGYVYQGRFSRFRGRTHGAPLARPDQRERLVVFNQNHDHIGNRADAARLRALVDGARADLAMVALLLGPNTPLLFMGEEYGETAPFHYFVSHSDPALVEAVRRGRREEFADFAQHGDVADPQSEETYRGSRLDHGLKERPEHRALLERTRVLLDLRRRYRDALEGAIEVTCGEAGPTLALSADSGSDALVLVLNLGERPGAATVTVRPGEWALAFDSAAGAEAGRRRPPRTWQEEQRLEIEPLRALLFVRET